MSESSVETDTILEKKCDVYGPNAVLLDGHSVPTPIGAQPTEPYSTIRPAGRFPACIARGDRSSRLLSYRSGYAPITTVILGRLSLAAADSAPHGAGQTSRRGGWR
ncbi:hypothetical protein EVAR_44919_1 [Eumeta japonica]|uniref:Uncharacterized protein n=1 Tax=Eumeta variegata TaxID=151549 RepID=A0A4C1XNI1_EUMVA|nr:hypothetical protein EVAR_44919_1 [Eumeta japonica]